MQSTYCTSWAWVGGGATGLAARKTFSAASSYWLQGPLLPCASEEIDVSVTPCGMVMLITPYWSMVGSVWSGSPLARMQVAHWSISWVALPPFGVVVVLPPPWPPPAVVLVPRLATCGEFGEPPLHAFNPMAAA